MSVGLRSPLLGGTHLLSALGVNGAEVTNQLDQIKQRLGLLQQLGSGFQQSSGMSPTSLASMLSTGNVPPQAAMPPPPSVTGGLGGFSDVRQLDLGSVPPGAPPYAALQAREKGAMLERFLTQNPFARQQIEMALGGKILADGVADGRLQIARSTGNDVLGGLGGINPAMGALDNINRGALNGAMPMPQGTPSMYQNMIGNGLANILGGKGGIGNPMQDLMSAQGLNPGAILGGPQSIAPAAMGKMPGLEQAFAAPPLGGKGGVAPGGAPLGGAGALAPMGGAGAIAPMGGAGAALGGINLNDPNLSVEDKVSLLLMQLMKQQDKEIEAQANNLQRLQGQGQNGQGMNGQQGSPSIDVESMKLKRLIDKRNQMFDTLRQIVDKYNQTAKGMIDSVAR